MTINRLGQGQTCTVNVRFSLDEIRFEFLAINHLAQLMFVTDGQTDGDLCRSNDIHIAIALSSNQLRSLTKSLR